MSDAFPPSVRRVFCLCNDDYCVTWYETCFHWEFLCNCCAYGLLVPTSALAATSNRGPTAPGPPPGSLSSSKHCVLSVIQGLYGSSRLRTFAHAALCSSFSSSSRAFFDSDGSNHRPLLLSYSLAHGTSPVWSTALSS